MDAISVDAATILQRHGRKNSEGDFLNIPLFTCLKHFGQPYAESVIHGLADTVACNGKQKFEVEALILRQIHNAGAVHFKTAPFCPSRKLEQVCKGLAEGSLRVFAVSYKHDVYGGGEGLRRKRMLDSKAQSIASAMAEIVVRDGVPNITFWLDQILGQRRPRAERNWVREGLLPYAVFDVLLSSYTENERGAWLEVERSLAGSYTTSMAVGNCSLLERWKHGGGPSDLMVAASSILRGCIAHLRGRPEDMEEIMGWAINTLDMSQIHKQSSSHTRGDPRRHFTVAFLNEPCISEHNLESILLNINVDNTREKWQSSWGWGQDWNTTLSFVDLSAKAFVKTSAQKFKAKAAITTCVVELIGVSNIWLFVLFIHCSGRPLKVVLLLADTNCLHGGGVHMYKLLQFDELGDSEASQVSRLSYTEIAIRWEEIRRSVRELGYKMFLTSKEIASDVALTVSHQIRMDG